MEMKEVLVEAERIASARQGEKWAEVAEAVRRLLELVEEGNPPFDAEVDEKGNIRFTVKEKRVGASPAKWLSRCRKASPDLLEVDPPSSPPRHPPRRGEDGGEPVRGAPPEGERGPLGLRRIRGNRGPEVLHDREPRTGRPVREALRVVQLAVAYRAGRPRARALLWRAKTPEGKRVHFLDRVYASEEGARRALKEWALSQGFFVKSEDTYALLGEVRGDEEEEEAVEAVNAKGEALVDLRVHIGKWDGALPYMDTLAFGVETERGLELRSRPPEQGRYLLARTTTGYPEEWFVCAGCGRRMYEEYPGDYSVERGGLVYCEGCWEREREEAA